VDWIGEGVKVTQDVWTVEGGFVSVGIYEFRGGGRVVHLVPCGALTEECDKYFKLYQTQEIEFRRGRMLNGKGTEYLKRGNSS
jgi:hypothetical protein